jgi:pilus assembly protein CpaE
LAARSEYCDMAKILVIDDDKSILRLLEFTLKRAGHTIVTSTDGVQGLVQAETQKPDLIVADVMMPNMTGYEFCKQARSKPQLKETPIIIFSARFQPIDKKTALEAGATDYLPKTTSPDDLVKRINELVSTVQKPTATQAVVGLFSLRGGAGVTSLAVNLAVHLAQTQKTPTALVDLARLGGHAALMLGLRPVSSIAQLFSTTQSDLTPDSIKPHLMQHNSGVQLLASSHVYGHELSLTDGRLEQLVTILKSGFPFIVLDIPHFLEPHFAPTLQLFDKITLVLSPDMPSLQSTAIALQSLGRLGVTEDKIVLVVNQVIPQSALPLETIQKAIKRPIAANVPFEPEMIKAVNSGKPLLLNNPQSVGAMAIVGLLNTILS